jgi:2-oxo-4-hydroxy-4-carboxy-5-ureidoimidazoline decarboxylase
MTGRASGVDRLNRLSGDEAERELMSCCGSRAWAGAVAGARPFAGEAALTGAAGAALRDLGWADVEEALSHHPRIGDRPEGTGREESWSRAEQAGSTGTDAETARELRAGNLAYEHRFGHVFLICATGLSARRILAALRERLHNDARTEREIVRTELAKITHLRLAHLGENR